MERYFPRIYGNDENRDRLGRHIENGTLSHAYILEGPEGSGKLFFAKEMAAALACDKKGDTSSPLPCGNCPHCKRILGTGSPDVRVIESTGATTGVELIREMREDMYLSSTEEEHKVYIVNRAHTMTPQAQNALLIVLEEPPTNCVIFLLTDRSDALLTTIRSRTQTIRMHLLTPQEMADALQNVSPARMAKAKDPIGYQTLLESSGGCLGKVLPNLEEKAKNLLKKEKDEVGEIVQVLLVKEGYEKKLTLQKSLPQKRQEITELLEKVLLGLRDLIVLSKDPAAPLVFFTAREDAFRLAEQAGYTALLKTFDRVKETVEVLGKNANVNLTLLSLFTHQ